MNINSCAFHLNCSSFFLYVYTGNLFTEELEGFSIENHWYRRRSGPALRPNGHSVQVPGPHETSKNLGRIVSWHIMFLPRDRYHLGSQRAGWEEGQSGGTCYPTGISTWGLIPEYENPDWRAGRSSRQASFAGQQNQGKKAVKFV